MHSLKWILGVAFSLIIVCCVPNFEAMAQEGSTLSTGDLKRLNIVIDLVRKYYYKSIDESNLFTRAIKGMLASLDPHSEYLDKQALKDLEIITWGKLGGIGVEVIFDHGLFTVISPLDDTPAYRAGIKSGDIIVQIDNKLVRDMTSSDAINMLRGKKGSMVKLTIVRKSINKPLIFNLRRENIKLKTVKEKILEPGYGYIRLVLFQEPTEKDMVRALRRLQKSSQKTGLKGLILDLRDNPGGLVDSAVEVADDFLDVDSLKNNDLIFSAKGQGGREILNARATSGDLLAGVPMVVLINEGSASASEIVAGALQDHKRAIVVGTRSFGKGTVQTVIPIDTTSALKMTTALYYTPRGRSIQVKGIEPDINVENIQISQKSDEEKMPRFDESTYIDHVQNEQDSGSDISYNIDSQQKRTKEEMVLARKDYQLYEALHILKSQNVTRRLDQ